MSVAVIGKLLCITCAMCKITVAKADTLSLPCVPQFVGVHNATDTEIEAMLDFKKNFGINKHARVKKNRSVFGFAEGDFLGEDSGLVQYYKR